MPLKVITKNTMNSKEDKPIIMRQAGANWLLMNRINKQQITLFRHKMYREGLEHPITTGKVEGMRSRGRQREDSEQCCSLVEYRESNI